MPDRHKMPAGNVNLPGFKTKTVTDLIEKTRIAIERLVKKLMKTSQISYVTEVTSEEEREKFDALADAVEDGLLYFIGITPDDSHHGPTVLQSL